MLNESLGLGVCCISVVFQFSGEERDGGGRVISFVGKAAVFYRLTYNHSVVRLQTFKQRCMYLRFCTFFKDIHNYSHQLQAQRFTRTK